MERSATARRVVLTVLLLLLPQLSTTARAETYYVAETGNDTGRGTKADPWRTIAHAVDTMVAGDTTYVRGGLYREEFIRFGRSGTEAAPIELLNYPGESPVIECIDAARVHRITLAHRSGYENPIGWIAIEGFEIRDCYDGLKFYNGHDLTIRGNWIHHTRNGQGILGNGVRVLIDRNVINHNGNFAECAIRAGECNQDHGIYAGGSDFTITNNVIYDNLAFGVQIAGAYSYDPARHAGAEFVRCDNWLIANNTFAYQNHRAGIVVWGAVTNSRIENNIFYENGVLIPESAPSAIDFVSAGRTGISVRNNLAYASGSGAAAFLDSGATEGVHYVASDNLVNTLHPEFVNAPDTLPAFPDFALTAASGAIDRGLTLPETAVSFDGTARPEGAAYDIGAYEFAARPSMDAGTQGDAGGDGGSPADASNPSDPRRVQAHQSAAPIQIDGELEECAWAAADWRRFEAPSRSDNDVRFAVLWDEAYLYIAADVTDASIETDAVRVFQNDGLELFFDVAHDRGAMFGEDDRHLGASADELVSDGAAAIAGAESAAEARSGGYVVEVALPWSALGELAPSAGTTLGFLLGNNDRDGGMVRQFDWLDVVATGDYFQPDLWGDLELESSVACEGGRHASDAAARDAGSAAAAGPSCACHIGSTRSATHSEWATALLLGLVALRRVRRAVCVGGERDSSARRAPQHTRRPVRVLSSWD